MSKFTQYIENLNDDEFEIAFETVQLLYGEMLDVFNERVNRRVDHAEISIKLHERREG